ncbi:MAG: hypothetical protein MJ238_05315 [Bacilli bacterium]|nr:hypothetical protein [Bacilli bacterium]
MANILKNKSIGYFIAAADALLAIILAIIFFATYNGAMANNAIGQVPETIGIFLIAGAVVEIAALLIPQYTFVHVGAVVLYCVALIKEVFLIPNLYADWINNVAYQGGNLPINNVYLFGLLIIIISGIAAAFMGLVKDEKAPEASWAIKGVPAIAKVGVAGVLVVASVLTSTLVSADLKKKAVVVDPTPVGPTEESWNPITDEIKEIADAVDYSFDPADVLIKQEETYDFNDATMKAVPTNKNRTDANLVYAFEGSYAEGYQADYSETYAYLYLWDDGIYGGTIGSTNLRGFWYNSSIAEGQKEETNEETGETYTVDVKDCLKMVSNTDKYEMIETTEAGGFYERQAWVYLGFSWGTRSMGISGYQYYPEVALAIDPSSTGTEFKVGETFDRSGWVGNRILKNLSYSAVFKSGDVKWTDPAGMLEGGKFKEAGEYEIKAAYNGFEATCKITVSEAEAE